MISEASALSFNAFMKIEEASKSLELIRRSEATDFFLEIGGYRFLLGDWRLQISSWRLEATVFFLGMATTSHVVAEAIAISLARENVD